MEKTDRIYKAYMDILKEELKAAMGCTEPISLAYAGALARKCLGEVPDRVIVKVSGSIIKNVKSVIIPNTGGMKGIEAAVAAGIIAGDAEKELEVISGISEEKKAEIKKYVEKTDIKVEHLKDSELFEITIRAEKGESYAKIHIINTHTNVVLIERDGKILFKGEDGINGNQYMVNRQLLNMEDIWDFIQTADIDDIRPILKVQAEYNFAIAKEGMEHNYGANIGKVLLEMYEKDTKTRAKAMAAAGSDARMSGCELPVVINSGSGNQGITVSVPVIVYANELGCSEEKMYRALALSNLTAIHQKSFIGTLSAYCGAISAGVGSGAGIAYLQGATLSEVEDTIVNALAITSGIICDGAKASCAAKIAAAVDAGIMGFNMSRSGQRFKGGDGIVTDDVESTIKNVGRLGKEGMRETNEEIISIMIGK